MLSNRHSMAWWTDERHPSIHSSASWFLGKGVPPTCVGAPAITISRVIMTAAPLAPVEVQDAVWNEFMASSMATTTLPPQYRSLASGSRSTYAA
eukprot:237078-Alexandrium_andersonii.AAC.1